MIKAVIFDLDGTLVNAYPAVASSVNHTLRAMGFSARPYNEIKRSVGGGDRKLMAHFVGETSADRALRIYRPHHARALQATGGVRLMPGARQTLEFLKARGRKLAIASNRPTKFTRIILKILDILQVFDVVLCADRLQRPKPYPDILWTIARRLDTDKKETLYVGDMTIDIQCARAAGMRMVAVPTGSSSIKELKDLKPWAVADKINQLKDIITEET